MTLSDMLADAARSVTCVDAEQAGMLIREGRLIIDVREPAEYVHGHIPGAVNLPRGLLEFRAADVLGHPDNNSDPVLVYCKNGGRSTLACATLKTLGYNNILMLTGGRDDWPGEITGGS